MIFQGDVSKYHPSDALMFLSQLSLNGVLTIACGQQLVILTFKGGHLVDAHSKAGDEKLLQALRFHKAVTQAQEGQIRKVQTETGIPVRQVLTALKLFPLGEIKKWLEISINEALLELFLMERGEFHFTDTPVEEDGAGIQQDTVAIAIRVLSHAEELRSFEKSIVTLDRGLVVKATPEQLAELPPEERTIAYLAGRVSSVRQLMTVAPYYSHKTMQSIEKQIGKLFDLAPVCVKPGSDTQVYVPSADSLFGMYKQAVKLLMHTDEVLKKVEAVVGFCKKYFDGILILTAREKQVIHCKAIAIEKGKNIRQQTFKGQLGSLDQDPVLQAVQKTGIGFFGKIFPSAILNKVAQLPANGECALFPIAIQAQLTMFFYAYNVVPQQGLSAHHYLELLSWLIMPMEKAKAVGALQTDTPVPTASAPAKEPAPQGGIGQLVAKIEELPPLPAMATKALQLLSDPETATEAIERAIAHDQALVAKIIRVSNSALYGGLQKVESLRQALTRLGAKTTKSLILAASTRSYFFKEHKGMKVWGPILWQHSVECGLAARRIAAACGYADIEQAFISGLMHDIGKLAILMLDDKKYQEINRIKVTEKRPDLEVEIQVVGASHTEIGRMLMEKWHMPEAVQRCVECHHHPDEASDHIVLAAMITYADHLSHLWGSHPQPGLEAASPQLNELLRIIGICAEKNNALVTQVQTDFQNADLMD
ncbi:MAG: HDOD domain-containing protein [Desulfobacteraceae bacterium]|nr:HDOD domain-containing protein [Desulfobacteraceae bacterium]